MASDSGIISKLYFITVLCFGFSMLVLTFSGITSHFEMECVLTAIARKNNQANEILRVSRVASMAIYASIGYGFFMLLGAIYTFILLTFSTKA